MAAAGEVLYWQDDVQGLIIGAAAALAAGERRNRLRAWFMLSTAADLIGAPAAPPGTTRLRPLAGAAALLQERMAALQRLTGLVRQMQTGAMVLVRRATPSLPAPPCLPHLTCAHSLPPIALAAGYAE